LRIHHIVDGGATAASENATETVDVSRVVGRKEGCAVGFG
jgi:hypothetical protein